MEQRSVRTQKGFVKIVLLTIVTLILINIFFGFDLVDYLDRETLFRIWNEEVLVPLKFIWNNIIIGLIWNNITKLFT